MRLSVMIVAVAVAAFGLSTSAYAEKLPAASIKQLLSGATAEYRTLGGLPSRDEFKPDGALHSEVETPRGLRRSEGNWWTNESGQLCRLWPKRNASAICVNLYREGEDIYAGAANAPERTQWKIKK